MIEYNVLENGKFRIQLPGDRIELMIPEIGGDQFYSAHHIDTDEQLWTFLSALFMLSSRKFLN